MIQRSDQTKQVHPDIGGKLDAGGNAAGVDASYSGKAGNGAGAPASESDPDAAPEGGTKSEKLVD